jgi:hypothetical protein
MGADISTLFWLTVAAFFALLTLGIWWVFLRPVERKTALGVITEKTHKGPSVTWQQPTGIRTNFWMPTRIPLAECYIFSIRLEGMPVAAIFSLNTTAAEQFNVGQSVAIDYEERGIPLIWKRVYVLDMKPA